MLVLLFPAAAAMDPCCPLCQRAIVEHRLIARGYQCVQDVVVNRDQETSARRARLAHLQTRVLKLHPFGLDLEGMATL